MKFVKRLTQQVSKRDNSQYKSQGDQRVASAPANDHQRAGNHLDERNSDAGGPQGPHRQESVRVRQKPFARMIERPKLKDLPYAGHEKDQAEHESREENGPGAIGIGGLIRGCHSLRDFQNSVRIPMTSS